MSGPGIAALHGNRAHAPASSIAALASAYTSGAALVGLEVRASQEGEPFVVHRADTAPWRPDAAPIAALDGAAIRALDLGAGVEVEGGTEQPWARPAHPIARVQSLGGMLDALPDPLELVIAVPADVPGRAALRARIVELLRRRGLERRAWLLVDAGEPAGAWGQSARTAAQLEGEALTRWLTAPGPPQLALAVQAQLVGGAPGARRRLVERAANNGPLVAVLDDQLDDADLREIAALLAGTADLLSFRSPLRLADVALRWRTLEHASFAGEDEAPARIHFGYAKANPYAHVHQRDGVHVELRPYDGRVVFGDEADPVARALSQLEERMHYALQDWPFYAGGGLGTAFPLDGDFSAEVDFEWATASQATMCELAVVNVDPPAHRPGWRTDATGARAPNPPASFRDKNVFFDPHGCPPFVGVERDEDDGFRITWNLGSQYDGNRYGRPHGNGRSMRGRLRLDRRGAWFGAYYRDEGNPDWVCLGVCRNDALNRRVYLRCAAKRWRQERLDGPGFLPIPDNHVVFRNLTIRSLLSASERSA